MKKIYLFGIIVWSLIVLCNVIMVINRFDFDKIVVIIASLLIILSSFEINNLENKLKEKKCVEL